ncbi:MAG: hypothetical protein JXM74_02565 [Fusobacteriaceae bacterium]|nr:hypothetical protein [Fusobacteriaceae bacterium]
MNENLEYILDSNSSIRIEDKIFPVVSLSVLNVTRRFSEHSKLIIEGTLTEEISILLKGKLNKQIEIIAKNVVRESVKENIENKKVEVNSNSYLIFSGIIENIEISVINTNTTFKLMALSHSTILDKTKRKRSFQDNEKTFSDITTLIKSVISTEFPDKKLNFVNLDEKKAPIKQLLVQYEETDWELLKRIASQLEIPIFLEDGLVFTESKPRETKDKSWCVWFGYPRREAKNPGFEKGIKELINSNGEEFFVFTSPNKYELGDTIKNNDSEYVILESTSYMHGNALFTDYKMSKKEKVVINKEYNENISGKQILAKIAEVGSKENITRVKINFMFDGKTIETIDKKHWFKFSTAYSGTDNGIYFMPEIGDNVLINFMDNIEDNSYAGESLRESNKFNDKYPEVEHKRIKIPTGQQVMLSEKNNNVMIIGNDNRTVFTEVEKASILLSAINSSIRMNESGMEFSVGDKCKISMTKDKIELTCGSSTILLNSNGEITGKGK